MEISGDLRLRYVVKLEFINSVFILFCLEEVDCSLLICNPNLVLGLCPTRRPGFTVSTFKDGRCFCSDFMRMRMRYVFKLIKLEFINCVFILFCIVLFCLEEVDCSLLICNPNLVLGLCPTRRPGFTVSTFKDGRCSCSDFMRTRYVFKLIKLEFINCVFILFCIVLFGRSGLFYIDL